MVAQVAFYDGESSRLSVAGTGGTGYTSAASNDFVVMALNHVDCILCRLRKGPPSMLFFAAAAAAAEYPNCNEFRKSDEIMVQVFVCLLCFCDCPTIKASGDVLQHGRRKRPNRF